MSTTQARKRKNQGVSGRPAAQRVGTPARNVPGEERSKRPATGEPDGRTPHDRDGNEEQQRRGPRAS